MDDAIYLDAFIGMTAFGAVILTAVLFERALTQLAAASIIGAMAVLLAETTQRNPNEWLLALFAVTGGVAGCGISLFAGSAFKTSTDLRAHKLRLWLRSELIPENWWDIIDREPVPADELVARWYVTITASTGSVVGALMYDQEFWKLALEAITPSSLIFTIILTIISVALIGPIEEWIRKQRFAVPQQEDEEGDRNNILTDLSGNFSWRSVGRVLLVGFFFLNMSVFHSMIEGTVKKGEFEKTFLITFLASAPAITTYFWSAALQRGAKSVSLRSFRATTIFNAFLLWPGLMVVIFVTALRAIPTITPHPPIQVAIFIFSLVTGIALLLSGPLTLAYCALTSGIAAGLGGWVLDQARFQQFYRSWVGLAFTGLGIAALSLLGTEFLLHSIAGNQEVLRRLLIEGPLAAFGWMAGLALSGFPKILVRSVGRGAGGPSSPQPRQAVVSYFQLVTGNVTGGAEPEGAPLTMPAAPAPTAEQVAQNKSSERNTIGFAFGIILVFLLVFRLHETMERLHPRWDAKPKYFFTDLKAALPLMFPRDKPLHSYRSHQVGLKAFEPEKPAFGPLVDHRPAKTNPLQFPDPSAKGGVTFKPDSPGLAPDFHIPYPVSALGVVFDLYPRQTSIYDKTLAKSRSTYYAEVTGLGEYYSDNHFQLQIGDRIVAVDSSSITDDVSANRHLLERESKIASITVVRPPGIDEQLHYRNTP